MQSNLTLIYTIENVPKIAAEANAAFESYGCNNRIQILEGSAQLIQRTGLTKSDRIARMNEPFDIIFVDLEFSTYLRIVRQVLNQNLLAASGVMLVDNSSRCLYSHPITPFFSYSYIPRYKRYIIMSRDQVFPLEIPLDGILQRDPYTLAMLLKAFELVESKEFSPNSLMFGHAKTILSTADQFFAKLLEEK
ncbi:hypothetical protein GQ44DRAFT_730556 [Phaeosphaeriaceae sp. PMI808]|nr:hypothetical protein GQ44DRAFT_730556 [Phaeosphaeriaceae sp. PMI808]